MGAAADALAMGVEQDHLDAGNAMALQGVTDLQS